MIKYLYNSLRIELIDDPTFTPGSRDAVQYGNQYFANGLEANNYSCLGVSIYDGDLKVNSCILIGTAGTTVHEKSGLIDGDSILICCGDSLFSLGLPKLSLNWQVCLDPAACFQVRMLGNNYLVHGELEISAVGKDGKVLWTFSGADIFVRQNGDDALTIEAEHIKLIDWEENEYWLDFNGAITWDSLKYSP